MARSNANAELEGRGRPPIYDLLQLYLHVTIERGRISRLQKRKISIRELTSLHRLRFDGRLKIKGLEGMAARPEIRGETLRRRFREAREAVGLGQLPPGMSDKAHEAFVTDCSGTLEKLIADLID